MQISDLTSQLIIVNTTILEHVKDMFAQAGVEYKLHSAYNNVLFVDPQDEDSIERMLQAEKVEFGWQ